MVRQERFQYQMKNVTEAKTLLLVRAAKRVHYELGETFDDRRYLEALLREFEIDHIRFRKKPSATAKQAPTIQEDYLCFDNILVRTVSRRQITDADEAQFREQLQQKSLAMGLIIGISHEGLDVRQVLLSSSYSRGEQ